MGKYAEQLATLSLTLKEITMFTLISASAKRISSGMAGLARFNANLLKTQLEGQRESFDASARMVTSGAQLLWLAERRSE
jgi:hypothetical protein